LPFFSYAKPPWNLLLNSDIKKLIITIVMIKKKPAIKRPTDKNTFHEISIMPKFAFSILSHFKFL